MANARNHGRPTPQSPFTTLSEACQFALDHDLMALPEITERWNRMSGENISRGRVFQILRRAEEKMAAGLREFAADLQ